MSQMVVRVESDNEEELRALALSTGLPVATIANMLLREVIKSKPSWITDLPRKELASSAS